MRVISGKARGRQLIAPEGMDTRPITAKIKEALFSSWQMRLYDSDFLDLFSGSGSMGIEAMSRGARSVVFAEKDKRAVDIINKNLAACKFFDGYELYHDDVFNVIEIMKKQERTFDIIYLDPPFTVDEIFLPVIKSLSDGKLLKEDAIIAIRTRKEKEMPESIGTITKYRIKTYGISAIHFYSLGETHVR